MTEVKTLAVPYPIQPAMFSEQRHRLAKHLKPGTCALIQGGSEIPVNYTDCNYLFRQDSYFYYLFGFEQPDCQGVVFPDGSGLILFPKLPALYATWYGPLPTVETVTRLTGVEEAAYSEDVVAELTKKGVQTIHVLNGTNTDSGHKVKTATFEGIDKFTVDNSHFLFETLSNQRTIKTAKEIDLLTYINKVSSNAHVHVMQHTKPGMSQHQLEANFLHHTYFHGGCRLVSYTCICATGHWGAVLHYPNNNQPVVDGTMALLDMGAEYHCYGSDITCSFPVNGKFTPEQKWVYEAVLNAQKAVYAQLKPGTHWVDMHRLALRVMSQALIDNGLLKGTVEEIEAKEIMYIFQPHGLGHLLGMDVHDVGGYPEGGIPRPKEQLCCRLRTARVVEEGMFLTVEPGLYFNQYLLGEAFKKPELAGFFNEEALRQPKYWEFGGVRIEDDILITRTGCKNLTCVPREVADIEAVMGGKHWDSAPKEYHNVAV